MPAPPNILKLAEDGDIGGRILQGGVHRYSGRDSGRPYIPHHFQHGGGFGSATLGFSDGGGRRRAGWERTRGKT